jgi:RNase P/RNase MRP subunit POP5
MISNIRDRYVVFKILSKSFNFEESEIKKTVWKNYQKIFGLYGSSSAGLFFEYFDSEQNIGIIRCSQLSLTKLQSILALMTEIGDNEVIFNVVFVSGTINKAKKHFLFNK